MRIISGKYKGKQIFPGKSFTARPTTDFAKESLFNILANSYDFAELEVLDLFAGTGSIGFEFASRDSVRVDSVEMNAKHVAFIQKTASELKFEQLKVIRMSCFQFLKIAKHKYDIIFADPPYDLDEAKKLPDLVIAANLLKPDGVFVFEHSKHLQFNSHPRITDHRNYGSVNFSFFK